jgi:hypothetical protein
MRRVASACASSVTPPLDTVRSRPIGRWCRNSIEFYRIPVPNLTCQSSVPPMASHYIDGNHPSTHAHRLGVFIADGLPIRSSIPSYTPTTVPQLHATCALPSSSFQIRRGLGNAETRAIFSIVGGFGCLANDAGGGRTNSTSPSTCTICTAWSSLKSTRKISRSAGQQILVSYGQRDRAAREKFVELRPCRASVLFFAGQKVVNMTHCKDRCRGRRTIGEADRATRAGRQVS